MRVRQVVRAVRRTTAPGAVLLLAATLFPPQGGGTTDVDDLSSRSAAVDLWMVMDRHECTTQGFAKGVVPASALVRSPGGRVRATSFAHGWAVLEGAAPGDLVALCLDDVRDLRRTVAAELPWVPADDRTGLDDESLRRLR